MSLKGFVTVAVAFALFVSEGRVRGDSRGDELANWIDERGKAVWGEPPQQCSDLVFARRVYLDILGRVPGISELRDYQDMGADRRKHLVEQLVFLEGSRTDVYRRLSANHFARNWQRVLVPPGLVTNGSAETVGRFLSERYLEHTPYDELIGEFVGIQTAQAAGNYYTVVGAMPQSYVGHLSRVALGVRIECAQCHDHPFAQWKQDDFWGLAAFYSQLGNAGAPSASISHEGKVYPAKLLWDDEPLKKGAAVTRTRLAAWMTSKDNPHFAATGANRFWQHLVGRGLYPDVENLDQAAPEERKFLDEFGQKFAKVDFDIQILTAAICKSKWYQAGSERGSERAELKTPQLAFTRPLKAVSPDQVFDSLEQSLLLPISRIDPASPRWTGTRTQMVTRLSETIGTSPEDYASGIPQALMLMNGDLTGAATDFDRSRLLRAVVESPFFDHDDRIRTLYLAVLTREPTSAESAALAKYINEKTGERDQQKAYGEILWALLNSPEFVLCR